MSGHSRWSQIRRKKELTDKKKGQIFANLSKAITLAARKGTDPKTNIALQNAIEQARKANMPNENIQRAIKKVSEKDSAQLEEILIEAVGPGGVALKIKGITDNKNRAISEIKKVLSDREAKMVQPGSIDWMFNIPVQVDEQTHQKIDELLEALDNNEDIEGIVTNLSL